MNYVPFGEKAMTLTVNLYLKTAHEPSVIEGNILQNIIDVSQTFFSFWLCFTSICLFSRTFTATGLHFCLAQQHSWLEILNCIESNCLYAF